MGKNKSIKILSGKKLNDDLDINDIVNSIIHGDTLDVLRKMPPNSVDLIITSPSYLVGKEYEDEQTFDEYKTFHDLIIKECKRILRNSGAIYWNVAQRPSDGEVIPLGAIFYNLFKDNGFFLKNWIIWHFEGGLKTKKRLSGRYENVLWFVKDPHNYIFNLDKIRIPAKWSKDKRNNPKGKNPTDFWKFETNDVWEINRVVNISKEKTKHPCQFPEKLVERVIKASSNKNDIVLDIFSGSGTTMKVAEEMGRRWIGIDKEKKYCRIAFNRVKKALK